MTVLPHEKEKFNFETGEVELLNDNFFQIYKDNVDLLIEIGKNNKTALNVFLWICKRMDNRNALVVSQPAIAESLGVTTRTIRYAIAYLKETKSLEILKSGNTNIYVLNSNVVWQDDANNKKHAHFSAKVYLSGEEQDNDYKKVSFPHLLKKPSKRLRKPQKAAIEEFEKGSKDVEAAD